MQLPHKPFLIVISSPSGAGKSTLCKMLIERDHNVRLSVSATTRKPRPGEVDGQHYFFLSPEKYQEMIQNNEFLEHAHIFDNHYGTPKKAVENQLKQNHDVLFDIDWQGARQLIEKYSRENILTIFILPPSIEELHKRLRNRAQDSEEVVLKRMQMAKSEVSHYDEYDFILINEDLETTYQKISKIIDSNRIKRSDQIKAKEFINKLLQS
jgi:guanylate kinase